MLTLEERVSLINLLQVCLDLPADEREQFEAMTNSPYSGEQLAAGLATMSGPKYVILDQDENALAVCGATQERHGVWRVWFLAREEAWLVAEEVTSIAVGLIQMMFHDYEAHRLEVVCLAKRSRARRWYERHLGLKCEGVMQKFCANGENAALYSAVRNW